MMMMMMMMMLINAASNEQVKRACAACDCGGKSDECYFDEELFERTGHGGHCTNCREDTFGVHCELCRESFYKDSETGHCVYCACHPEG